MIKVFWRIYFTWHFLKSEKKLIRILFIESKIVALLKCRHCAKYNAQKQELQFLVEEEK